MLLTLSVATMFSPGVKPRCWMDALIEKSPEIPLEIVVLVSRGFLSEGRNSLRSMGLMTSKGNSNFFNGFPARLTITCTLYLIEQPVFFHRVSLFFELLLNLKDEGMFMGRVNEDRYLWVPVGKSVFRRIWILLLSSSWLPLTSFVELLVSRFMNLFFAVPMTLMWTSEGGFLRVFWVKNRF